MHEAKRVSAQAESCEVKVFFRRQQRGRADKSLSAEMLKSCAGAFKTHAGKSLLAFQDNLVLIFQVNKADACSHGLLIEIFQGLARHDHLAGQYGDGMFRSKLFDAQGVFHGRRTADGAAVGLVLASCLTHCTKIVLAGSAERSFLPPSTAVSRVSSSS